jgi:DNA repair exonuclease SbcCD nuclease subunit
MRVVLLPGNHDPAIPEGIYGRLAGIPNLSVLGVTHEHGIVFPHLDLEVWGRAHRDYGDMVPFETVRPRCTRWQIALAHGHYQPIEERVAFPRPSWLISDEEIAATGADYVALGHWNRAARVGNGGVPAYYSGSPEYAGTVNAVRLSLDGEVVVSRVPLDIAREVEPQYVP